MKTQRFEPFRYFGVIPAPEPESLHPRFRLGLTAKTFSTLVLAFVFSAAVFPGRSSADDLPQDGLPQEESVPIEQVKPAEGSLEQRLNKKINKVDVRDMPVIDVIRFIALEGNFNIVTASNVQGRATFYLKDVAMKDALDIACMSNHLAYVVDNDIIRVMTEAEYEATYGRRFNDRNVVEIMRLKYAKPDYVMTTLENLKSELGRLIIDQGTGSIVIIDTPDAVKKMKEAVDKIDQPLEAVVYPLMYAKAADVAEQIKARLESNAVGTVSVDERTNKVIVRTLPGRRQEVGDLIASLDAPTKEVLVEARVLQVVFKPEKDFGIDWQLDFRNSHYDFLRNLSFKNIMLDEDNISSSGNLYSNFGRIGYGDFDADKFEAAVRALKQVSDTKILSNPKVLVTNNEEAKIHVGDTVPYIISTTSGTGDNAITSEDVRFVDVGLKLNVTPTISDNGFVTMALRPEISTVTARIQSQGGGIPQVNKTLVETTVMVKDGMTIVLGGLKKDNKVLTRKGVPILMDLPFIRNLFSSTAESIESTEIVILITPHIISGAENFRGFKGTIKPAKIYDDGWKKEGQALKLKE